MGLFGESEEDKANRLADEAYQRRLDKEAAAEAMREKQARIHEQEEAVRFSNKSGYEAYEDLANAPLDATENSERAQMGLTKAQYNIVKRDEMGLPVADTPANRKLLKKKGISDEHAQNVSKTLAGKEVNGKKGYAGLAEAQKIKDAKLDALKSRKRRGKGGLSAEQQALRALLAAQTHQNFIMQNMRTFSSLAWHPEAQDLEHLILVSKYKGNLVNKLTTSARLGPLMDASPYQLSQLVPYFRLAKKNKEGKLTEFQFMDRLKDHYYDQEGVKQVLKSSLGQGVGLKSFRWRTTGTNMFSAPRTLRATLSLHFQSVSELVRTARIDEREGPLWQDLIVPQRGVTHPQGCPTAYEDINSKINRLASQTEARAMGPPAQVEKKKEPPDFSLVVEAGWNYTVKSDIPQNLKEAVDMSRTVLNLTLVSHKFNFRDNGSIDLDIEYIARLESIIESYGANLLTAPVDGKPNNILTELAEARRKAAQMNVALDSPTGDFNCLDRVASEKQKERIDKQASKVDKKIRKLEQKVEALVTRSKVSMYGKFTQHMIEQQLLIAIDLPEKDYAEGNLPPADEIDLDNSSFLSKDSANKKNPTRLPSLTEGTAKAVNQISTGRGADREVSAKKLLSRALGHIEWDRPPKKGYERLSYFYLGDLINFFAGILPAQDANSTDRFEIVLGDLVFLDYKQVGATLEEAVGAYGKDEYEDLDETEKKEASTLAEEEIYSNMSAYTIKQNLATVPVSFAAYTKWFAEEVINGDTVFTFKSFLQSLTTKLIVGALQATDNSPVSGDLRRMLKERNRVRATTIYGKNKALRRGRLTTETLTPRKESNLLIKPALAEEENNAKPVEGDEHGNAHKNRQFFILSASRLPRASQVVDEKINAEEGVYHLKIGADRGLLKKLSLERESNARIRDANIMRAYNQGSPSLGIIQEPYNASIQVYGCSFFQPGQYVYLNPTNIGLGTSLERYSIARRIGIGGFYIITEVSTLLEKGILETTLKCIFQDYGYLPDSREADDRTDPVQEISMDDMWKEVMREEIDRQDQRKEKIASNRREGRARAAKLAEENAQLRAQCDKFK